MGVRCLSRYQMECVLQMHGKGETIAAIAREMYCSQTTIYHVLKANGYKGKNRSLYEMSEAEQRAYRLGYNAGWNAQKRGTRNRFEEDEA